MSPFSFVDWRWGRHALIIAAALVAGSTLAAARDIAVVANKGTAQTGLSAADLIKVCRGQTSKWPNGKLVTVVLRDPADPDMNLVVEKVYGTSAEAVRELIDKVNHEHTNRAGIVIVKSDEDVIKKVQATPGAVGFVDVYSIRSGVDVIRIGGKLPLEAGYLLHGN